jgi:hypothetical protein
MRPGSCLCVGSQFNPASYECKLVQRCGKAFACGLFDASGQPNSTSNAGFQVGLTINNHWFCSWHPCLEAEVSQLYQKSIICGENKPRNEMTRSKSEEAIMSRVCGNAAFLFADRETMVFWPMTALVQTAGSKPTKGLQPTKDL